MSCYGDPVMDNFESADDIMPSWASYLTPSVHATETIVSNGGSFSEFCISKTEPRRRRGRPRSSVYAYFSRLQDDNGMFLGNQCCFCPFISRDKSENPTYLSRHIRRACRAPPHVKEALGLRTAQSAFLLPVDTSFTFGRDINGNHPNKESVTAKDLTFSQPLNDASRCLKTTFTPDMNSRATTRTIPSSNQPSCSLDSKSRGAQIGYPSRLHSGVEKIRRIRHPIPTLKGACGNDVGSTEFERSLVLPKTFRENAKFLMQRAFIPVEVKAKPLNDLPPSSVSVPHQNPYISDVIETRSELFEASLHARRSTNIKLPDRISSAVGFLLAHHISFPIVRTPVFRRIPLSMFQRIKKVGTHALPSSSNLFPKLPSEGELLECLINSSRSDIINGFRLSMSPHVSSAHLIICFADAENPMLSNRDVCSSDLRHDVLIASYFCLTSDNRLHAAQLSYIGSRNCGADPYMPSLSSIVDEAESQVSFPFRHILLSRCVTNRLFLPPPGHGNACDWTLDVCQEVDALCRELISKVPLLKRVHRRNRIISSFFLELSEEDTGRRLFGGSELEKDMFQRYVSWVSVSTSCELFWYSCHVVQSAVHTCSLLRATQANQSHKRRIMEIQKFLVSLSEENSGNVALCREVVRMVLSPSYLKDLKDFISFLKPLTNIISLYCRNDAGQHWSSSSALPSVAQSRSIGYVLHDCAIAFAEMPIHDNRSNEELLTLKDHVFSRLFKEGPGGLPPVVSDACHLAAILNPAIDIDAEFLPISAVLSRAVQVVRSRYDHVGAALERCLSEFQKHKRMNDNIEFKRKLMGCPSRSYAFCSAEYVDPLLWWTKNGEGLPHLRHVALQVLDLPATSLSVIRFITNTNANCDDLRGRSRDSLKEKRRFTSWNLKLGNAGPQWEGKMTFPIAESDVLVAPTSSEGGSSQGFFDGDCRSRIHLRDEMQTGDD